MKTITIKSVLTSLCAISLLASGSQAQGKLSDIVAKSILFPSLLLPKKPARIAVGSLFWAITKISPQKNSIEGLLTHPDSLPQKFAEQCYDQMNQLNKREKTKAYPTNLQIVVSYDISHSGLASAEAIFLNQSIWETEIQKSPETLSPKLKRLICHETTHIWHNHHQSTTTADQIEFEAETLTVQTLHAMNEKDAIFAIPCTSNYIFYHLQDRYAFGALNGIAKTQDANLKKEAYNQAVRHKTCVIGFESERELQTLAKHWKPVDTYEEASQQAQKILQNHDKLSRLININNLFRTPVIAGALYGLYKYLKK